MSLHRFRVLSIVALSVFPLGAAGAPAPKDEKKSDIFLLEINKDGWLQLTDPVTGEIDILESEVRIARFLQDMYAGFKRERGEHGIKRMVVTVRADKDAKFQHVYRVVRSATDAGFSNVAFQTPKEGLGPPQTAQKDAEQDKAERIRVRLYANENGMIARISWKIGKKDDVDLKPLDPADAKEGDAKLKTLDPSIYGLIVKLREHQPKKDSPQPMLAVECEASLRYAELVKVLEAMRELGFKSSTIKPLPKEKK